jgi:hypothetical protein
LRLRPHGLPPARGDALELAVTIELVAEEVREAERARPQPGGDLRQRALVDLEQPEPSPAGREQRRGDAGDEVAPAGLCASGVRAARIPAAIAVVVVLPFVAETRADPSGRRAARRSIASGSSFQSSFPGSVVPPPVRASRDSPPAARAAAISSASGIRGRTARA